MRVYILVSYSLHANPFLEEKLRFHWQEVIVFILLRCILLSYISQLSTIAIAWKRVVNYTHAFINLDPNVSIAFLTIYTIICLRCLSQQLYYSKRMSFRTSPIHAASFCTEYMSPNITVLLLSAISSPMH